MIFLVLAGAFILLCILAGALIGFVWTLFIWYRLYRAFYEEHKGVIDANVGKRRTTPRSSVALGD